MLDAQLKTQLESLEPYENMEASAVLEAVRDEAEVTIKNPSLLADLIEARRAEHRAHPERALTMEEFLDRVHRRCTDLATREREPVA